MKAKTPYVAGSVIAVGIKMVSEGEYVGGALMISIALLAAFLRDTMARIEAKIEAKIDGGAAK
jgi:hypothetical protein